MNDTLKIRLTGVLAQSEAGALAVLVGHLREKLKTQPDIYKDSEEIGVFLEDLEQIAINSITTNDGLVAHWIGVAAKQMNPLLV
jgi:hypothetical protein